MDIFKKNYLIDNQIIKFNIDNKSTKSVTDQYNVNPFPNYRNLEDKKSLLYSGNQNIFSKKLKKFISLNKVVLEAGSGTCQLSNYLSISTNNKIYALDPTIKSLELGASFAKNNDIKNTTFIQGDILDLDNIFKHNVFDLIYCSGVLHHTENPYQGFKNLVKPLKKNGHIVIGLYNKYGRFRTHIRQFIYKRINKKLALFLDPILRDMKRKSETNKFDAWVKDQYEHPIESAHTYDEVLRWFSENNIEFLNFYPNFYIYEDNVNFFNKKPKSNFIERIFEQIFMIFNKIGSEGGLFIVIGKKK